METAVIAGGGPTGLMLACELRLAGVDVLVLERLAEPSGESRAGGIHARTMEILDQRGMLEPFLAEGRTIQAGHFAGLWLDFSGFATRYPYLLAILQRRIERLIEAHALELGVRLRREVEVTGLEQHADGVRIGTSAGPIEAAYLVGCDGGRSAVRRLAGIDFPGTPASMTSILGDVELADPPAHAVFQERHEHGNFSVLDFEPGWYRVMTSQFDTVAHRDEPVTVDDLRTSLKRIAGTDFGLHSPRWISRYNDAARQAARYRSGRVLLAGDAAHIHYPAGGQGLNTGVQDAFNLGWKLAAVVRGEAGDELLDTYETERHPVAARVLQNTRAQTALSRTDPQTGALREVFGPLIEIGEVNRRLGLMVTGLDIRYELGDGPSPLGERVPDLDMPDGSRLYEQLRDGRPKLLGGAEPMLIRPDGHIAWVGAMGEEALVTALARWCPSLL
jgi:2-polyprenyl-6-methoxyphenol hydroxylase-like FAD-dependent oxidoreductase